MKFYLQVGICPLCGKQLKRFEMSDIMMIKLPLNDGSVMPQPVCLADRERLQQVPIQQALLEAIKTHWLSELEHSSTVPDDLLRRQQDRITRLEIRHDGQSLVNP